MGDIKFRGKRKDNGEWVYGYYYEHQPPLQCMEASTEKPKSYILKTGFADWGMPRQVDFIEVIPETVGQYSSLKDKTSTYIYEGDILKYDTNDDDTFTVIFILGMFIVKSQKYGWTQELYQNAERMRIIGNIYESKNI